MRRLFSFIVVFTSFFSAWGQGIEIGQWRYHYPRVPYYGIEHVDDYVYMAGSFGLLRAHIHSLQTNGYAKTEGLSALNIGAIKYHKPTKTLIIGYQNGLIDLFTDQGIETVRGIDRANIVGSKAINNIAIKNSKAYLFCDFGLVVLDIVKKEIPEDNQNLGQTGNTIAVTDGVVFNDTLFLATAEGIKYAMLNSNLRDFRNWTQLTDSDFNNAPTFKARSGLVTHLEVHNQQLLAVVRTASVATGAGFDSVAVMMWNGEKFAPTGLPLFYEPNNRSTNLGVLQSTEGGLLLGHADSLLIFDDTAVTHTQILPAKDTLVANRNLNLTGAVHIGQNWYWATTDKNNYFTNRYSPHKLSPFNGSGPFAAPFWKLVYTPQNLFALNGGYDGAYTQLGNLEGYSLFNNQNGWSSRSALLSSLHPFYDITSGVYSPADDKLYLCAHGGGLLKTDPNTGDVITQLRSDNSALISAITNAPEYTRITDAAIEQPANLWVANHTVPPNQPSVHKYNTLTQAWGGSYLLPWEEARFPLSVVVDFFGNKWVSVSPGKQGANGSLMVFKQNNETETGLIKQFPYRMLSTRENAGALPNQNIRSIAVDNDGFVWVGTDDGVAVFYETANVLSPVNSIINANRVYVEGRPLLEGQSVRKIVVDGANRKWFATAGAGAWLFGADGTEQIHHFTTQNSPLPSNIVTDIAIDENTGEVFFNTDGGLVSYRSDATKPLAQPYLKIFPNPVPAGFNGSIGINGLADGTIVKITNVTGKLLYQAEATGGMLAWNGKDYNNVAARPGVYLVLVATNNGESSVAGRIVILH